MFVTRTRVYLRASLLWKHVYHNSGWPSEVSSKLTAVRNVAFRSFASSSNNDVILDFVGNSRFAIMKLNKPPVNSLTFEFMQKLTGNIKLQENNPECKAIIITSNVPNVFCGGLDFKEIINPEKGRLQNFTLALHDLWVAIYGSKLPIIFAINGSSVAGGCLLSLAADYRIMREGNFKIGLSEVHLGISVSSWIAETMINVVGRRRAELAITTGSLYNPKEALAIGLIDEVASNNEDLLNRAECQAEVYARAPSTAWYNSRMAFRQPRLAEMEINREKHASKVQDATSNEIMQANLKKYIENFQRKKKNDL